MSRRTGRRVERRRAQSTTPQPRARRSWPWVGLAVVAIVIVSGLALIRGRTGGHAGGDDPASDLGSPEMLERERQAIARKDWVEAYDWAARLAQREPRNASLLLGEGTALHNVAWGVKHSGERFTARTSLDRLTLDLQAMALMDSAARLADTPEMWARARGWQGQLYEVLGLPGDALDIYYEVGQRVPTDPKAIGRGRYVLNLFHDPTTSGTTPPGADAP